MSFDFDLPVDRRDSDSAKWNRYPEDVLPLWVADMDFRSPPPVIQALLDRLEHGVFGYSSVQEATRLAVQNWLYRRHSWRISLDEIILLSGVVDGFNLAARAFTNPGDSILFHTPAYHPFYRVARGAQLAQISISLDRDHSGRFYSSPDGLRIAAEPSTRLFLLCNPHNPTGRVFTRAELLEIADFCLARNILICSDEIHSDIVYPPHHHIPIASLSEEISQQTITLLAPSKTFNLAGLKTSIAIIPNPRLRQHFISQAGEQANSVNVFGETALAASYGQGEEWLEELLRYLGKNRQLLHDYIGTEIPGLVMHLPESTFLGWLDFSALGIAQPGMFMLETARVALNPGEWFGEAYSQFARINFGCPRSTLLQALERIKESLQAG